LAPASQASRRDDVRLQDGIPGHGHADGGGRLYGCGDGRVGSLLGSVFSAGILGEINGLVAAAPTTFWRERWCFGVVIMIIILKPKGLFSLRGR